MTGQTTPWPGSPARWQDARARSLRMRTHCPLAPSAQATQVSTLYDPRPLGLQTGAAQSGDSPTRPTSHPKLPRKAVAGKTLPRLGYRQALPRPETP
jgi:hypothetical protein